MGASTKYTEVVFRIRRFDPTQDADPHWEEYRLPYTDGMTVLDGLKVIKETQAPSLSWRSSCRMGVCGSCGMFINGQARLACNTQITELGTPLVTVAPLPNFNTIRDLVPDLVPMFDAHVALQPFIIREDAAELQEPTAEFWQSRRAAGALPPVLVLHQVRLLHGRLPHLCDRSHVLRPDAARRRRIATTPTGATAGSPAARPALSGDRGPWRCHYAGECSRVCPKGVDPAKAIQLMKRELVLDYLRLRKKKCPSALAAKPAEHQAAAGHPGGAGADDHAEVAATSSESA